MQGKYASLARLGPLLLPMVLSAAASATEESAIVGSIAGELDDQQQEWFIVSQGAESNATFTELGDHLTIDLVGFIEPDDWRVRDSLSLSITVVEGKVTEFDVLHPIGTTAMPPVFTSDGAEIRLILETLSLEGARAHVAGRLEGSLALQKALGEDATLEEGVEIAVEFDAHATRIEY